MWSALYIKLEEQIIGVDMDDSYFFGRCYKFRAFFDSHSEERKYLGELIANRHMMFSSPTDFNDPYDCRPTYTRGQDADEDRRRISKAWDEGRVKADHAKPNAKGRSQHITKVMENLNTPEGAAKSFQPILESKIGVFCMSKSWKILTQWAYYADLGAGLCLEYDIQPDSEFSRVYQVTYSDSRPVIEITRTLYDTEYQTESLFAAVTHKASVWSHEKEVRALHNKSEVLQHPPGILKSITVGQLIKQDNLDWLRDLLKEHDLRKIPIYQVYLSEKDFSLERKPLHA